MEYNWDFGMIFNSYELWWFKAMLVTLAYAIGTVLVGLLIGIICGTALLANRWWINLPIHVYVEIFRCTPVLVQIVWFYFALPMIVGANLPAWLASGIGLSLYMGCF